MTLTAGLGVAELRSPAGPVLRVGTPALAADEAGRLFVAWHDARNGDWDVFLRRSIDGGRTWERPVRLNDDPMHDNRHQYLPRLAVSPSGRIDAIFYDRRGNTENIGTDVFYTYSADGGRTFSRNRQINEVTFSSVVGARYLVPSARGLIEFGSRLGLVSGDTKVLAAWTDTSNTRRGIKAQDVMATEIDFAGASGMDTVTRMGRSGPDGHGHRRERPDRLVVGSVASQTTAEGAARSG